MFKLNAAKMDEEVGERRLSVLYACLIILGMKFENNQARDW
jgi:hypothetical protein